MVYSSWVIWRLFNKGVLYKGVIKFKQNKIQTKEDSAELYCVKNLEGSKVLLTKLQIEQLF